MDTYTENQRKHLDHEFYKDVDLITKDVAEGQILKGAEKYDEPFNPFHWNPEQLLHHTLQELRDAQVYTVGMYKVLTAMKAEIRQLREENHKLKACLNSKEETP